MKDMKQAHRLDASHNKYIKMTVPGSVTKAVLGDAISDLMTHEEYVHKHVLWDFSESSMGLNISDLREIIGILRLYQPKGKNFAAKSAIVVPGVMHKAMVDMFITMSKMLPFKYAAFRDMESAIRFLVSD